jgi:uncharacterized membrane protein YecN with MAPEG domain
MQTHYEVAVVTLLALLVYIWMSVSVGGARAKSGIPAPAMTGDPTLERYLRVQGNTLEWLPVFLPSLWIFALYWNDRIAALVGVVWIIGRILYALGYWSDASKRSTGFMIQMAATAVLLLGGLGRIVWVMVTTGTY